jgi:transcriptional regulator with XRE-family HTH domain
MWIRRWLAQQMIAEDLKEARRKRSLSQRQLSLKSGVSERTIWNIENGVGTLRLESLILLALAMGERLDMFLACDVSAAVLRDRRKAGLKAAARRRRR